MAATLSPPPVRHRASSTNLRPALTISTLGPRPKACAFLDPIPASPQVNADMRKVAPSLASPSRLSSLLERCVDLLHVYSHLPSYSTPSSPLSPSEDSVLPMSATTTVGDDVGEKHSALMEGPKSCPPRPWFRTMPSAHVPILFVITMFPVSTALVVIAFCTLPFTFSWPQNLADLAQLGRELHGYSQSGPGALAHVIGVVSAATIWMHAWSIPGSVLWNVLAGALFSPLLATLLLAVLTTVGSILATLLSAPLSPFLTRFFPRPLAVVRSVFEADSLSTKATSPTWVRLTVFRLIGIVPWSGINVACGVLGVALWDCFLGTFIGAIPWTAVTCQIGDILQTLASTPSPNPQTISSILASPTIITKLVFLSILSLAPILGRDHLKAWLSPVTSPISVEGAEDRISRWMWVTEWRSKVRLPSRSRSRHDPELELEAPLTEKRQSVIL